MPPMSGCYQSRLMGDRRDAHVARDKFLPHRASPDFATYILPDLGFSYELGHSLGRWANGFVGRTGALGYIFNSPAALSLRCRRLIPFDTGPAGKWATYGHADRRSTTPAPCVQHCFDYDLDFGKP